MDTIELKRNKTFVLIFILVSTCCAVFAIWGITMPDVEIGYKIILIAFIVLFIYQSRKMLVSINDPILVLTKASIQVLSENKHFIYLWSDTVVCMVDFEVRSDGVGVYSLTIRTKAEIKTFEINGITKSQEELKEIISRFRA
jgi:hypothetical protein